MTTLYLLNSFASMLVPPVGAPAINARALLIAIAEVESNCGKFPLGLQSRYEKGFRKRYLSKEALEVNGPIDEVCTNYGADRIATSYGVTQLMAAVAYEMGMPAHRPPEDLYLPYVCLWWTVELLNRRTMPNAWKAIQDRAVHYSDNEPGFIRAIADAYNSGSARDGNVPVEYIEKIWKAYQEAK